ncbi:hypothetical protein ACLOJK_024879 [Asimina triloba]
MWHEVVCHLTLGGLSMGTHGSIFLRRGRDGTCGDLRANHVSDSWHSRHSLPDGLGELESLERLSVRACPKLESLPAGMAHLNALQSLEIQDCQLLGSLPPGLRDLPLLPALSSAHPTLSAVARDIPKGSRSGLAQYCRFLPNIFRGMIGQLHYATAPD